ncbi:hypothetical protein BHE90_009367 [Fusarium euwallaceae]|uniref:Isopropylmalate dehydrogenase-like domain-containing protein n=1 Tax=Fusarium euwallaceae TaxID=1147111 RepID=A0A430LKG0_9HYPO|nr:hypothetical protein BHE90_009367 [Fusarium euwallaceae]
MAEHKIVVLGIAKGVRCSVDATGSPLTDETLAAANAVLLGSIGGPEWGTGSVRPEPRCRGTDFVIVRELTGGIYFGERNSAWDTEPYSRAEVERFARLSGVLVRGSGDKKILEKEFPDFKVERQLIDSAAMIMVKNPHRPQRDEASVIPGSIGLLPSASLSGIPDGNGKCNGIYEPIYSSAPDISSKGIVNLISTILSVTMLLRYFLNLPGEIGDAVVKELTRILKA